MRLKRNPTRKERFDKIINGLSIYIMDNLNIVFERDWGCCNNCGNYEIIEKYNNNMNDYEVCFKGFMFYHIQERDNIQKQLKRNNDIIKVHIAWGLFDNYINRGGRNITEEQEKFIRQIKELRTDKLRISCKDISTKFIFEIDLSE